MNTLYRNPITFGKSPNIEAYKIALCPVCAWPALSIIEYRPEAGRRIDCACGRGHSWTTEWSGETREIVRPPQEQP